MRIHYIEHAFFESPGVIEKWARDRGHEFGRTQSYANDKLPEASDVDFLLVLGGPQSPIRIQEYPYLTAEIKFISAMIARNRPVVGLCLGAQLIAEALGARTRKSPEKEVGVFPIQLTDDGRKDPLFEGFPAEFDVMHWHNDMPDIPEGATLLARSAGCPHQAFRFGDRTYGFQFHMEISGESIVPLLENAAGDLTPGKYTRTAAEILSFDFEPMNRRMTRVLDRLVELADG